MHATYSTLVTDRTGVTLRWTVSCLSCSEWLLTTGSYLSISPYCGRYLTLRHCLLVSGCGPSSSQGINLSSSACLASYSILRPWHLFAVIDCYRFIRGHLMFMKFNPPITFSSCRLNEDSRTATSTVSSRPVEPVLSGSVFFDSPLVVIPFTRHVTSRTLVSSGFATLTFSFKTMTLLDRSLLC